MNPVRTALVLEGRPGISRHPLSSIGVMSQFHRRQTTALVGQAEVDGVLKSLWGDMPFYAGDYILTDIPVSHAWVVARAIFEASYEPNVLEPAASESVMFGVYAGDEEERYLVGHWADAEIAEGVARRLQAIALERDPDRAPGRPVELSDGGLVVEISERPIRLGMPTDEQLGALLDERGQWKHDGSLDELETFDGPTCRVCGCTDIRACAGGCSWVDDPHDDAPICSRCYSLVLAAV